MNHFFAIFHARNTEFYRDRATLGWNLVFPILLIAGFSVMFSGGGKSLYKIGVIEPQQEIFFKEFLNTKYLETVDYKDPETALEKLRQHSLDLIIDRKTGQYWVNGDAPNGYIIEKVLLSSGQVEDFKKEVVTGDAIRYLDWVLPGIIGMNMMFSCLFGVGYVIVRYRKSGVLKRLKATPLNAFTFLSAQVASRMFVVMLVSTFLFVSMHLVFDFHMSGSWIGLLIVAALGAMAMISLGLMMASQTQSEELAGGLLNMVTWPMMMLSGVWFSLEGSPEWVQQVGAIFPLTHMLEGARSIMLDGASMLEIWNHILVLLLMSFGFLLVGAWRFEWGE